MHEMKYAYLYHRASARGHFNTVNKMEKVLNGNFGAGSEKSNEPRLVGSSVGEILQEGWNRNTELGCDVKTILRSDRVMKTGKDYQGVLRRDSDAIVDEFLCRDPHYTFVETLPWTTKRNPHVFSGRYITITRRDDGTLRPNFKLIPADMSVDNYAFGVYHELLQGLAGLVGKSQTAESR